MSGGASVEAPSGKDRADENFPVGSFLIAPHLRRHVHAFYAFARNADDIADSPTLAAADKIDRLNVMEDVLRGKRIEGSPTATVLRMSLAETGVTATHARDLLHAFRHDARENRTPSWPALMEYCRYSAMPVGRYVLDLHGESQDLWPHSDALCSSLQVLNHIQDCAQDLADLDRCYLPDDMMAAAGAGIDDLCGNAETPELRRVLTQLLVHCTELNRAAAGLPRGVEGLRLRLECGVIVGLAERLTARLRRHDVLAMHVQLTKIDVARAGLRALRWAT